MKTALNFPSDEERFSWIKENLYVPVVCDVLDGLGYRNQAMHHRLRPLDPDHCVIVGRARTFRWMDTDYVMDDPYGLEIEAMDALGKGDVVVHSTDPAGTNAPWGELMSTIAKRNGATGCICDSMIRDCRKIMAMEFPVFYGGIRPLDSLGRGRVMAYDVPVRCGDVLVHPGELIFSDFDGIVVIPLGLEDEVLAQAYEKVTKENQSRIDLLNGDSLRTVFDRHGVL
ncbi:RraA family protein [Larkinella humicola]|uniref:Putative 4-hydroxy-4-methyl-2-oxoglutarate aldolase n=1 Tax=Larkinella humicola TaxID=2607654 RepID=A0A5N1J7H8_9BACT|nr:RraA family protein [Larkinella humicola]KAA9346755.1 RraA family protein [Larkinella humicola]